MLPGRMLVDTGDVGLVLSGQSVLRSSVLNKKFIAFDQVFAGALRRQKRSID